MLLDGAIGAQYLDECQFLGEVGHIGIDAEGRGVEDGHINGVGCGTFLLGFHQLPIACSVSEASLGKRYIEESHFVR